MRASDLEHIVKACRELAITMVPERPAPPTIHDPDAERTLISSAWEGLYPSEDVEPEDYFLPLHSALAEILLAARAAKIYPTIDLVVELLGRSGITGPHLHGAVERIMHYVPACSGVPLGVLAKTVRDCARRRRLVARFDVARAVLLEPSATAAEIKRELAGVSELLAGLPSAPRAMPRVQ